MELEGEDCSKIKLEPDADNNTVFGRGSGFSTKDRTVSRRHLFFTTNNNQTEPTSGGVSFEVLGKNPKATMEEEEEEERQTGIRDFRRLERGDMEAGDCFCVCGQSPVWFTVKRNEKNELGLDVCVNVSDIDPAKEFGFLLIGHEFDQYPKQRIRDARDCEWFLEEPRKNGDDDEDEDKEVKRGVWRRRKKAKGDEDDDDWTDDGDKDEEQTAKLRKAHTHYYSTQSKDGRKRHKDVKHNQSSVQRSIYGMEENEEGEDEDDETLGGFIVDNDEVEPEEESDMDEDRDYDDDDDDD